MREKEDEKKDDRRRKNQTQIMITAFQMKAILNGRTLILLQQVIMDVQKTPRIP